MASQASALISYLPTLVSQRLMAQSAPPSKPESDWFNAAILSVDISGFTAITEQMAQRGPAGVEELSQLLNRYFSMIIDSIILAGGDVVKFAGDGLLVTFQSASDSDAVEDALEDAAACALQLQALMLTPGFEHGPLSSLRIGISAGPVLVAYLGGVFGRWETFIGGAALQRAACAEQAATPGQIVVDRAVWRYLEEAGATGRLFPSGDVMLQTSSTSHSRTAATPPTPPMAAASMPIFQNYLPKAVLARILAGQTDWLAELRRISVLFVHLPELDHAMALDRCHAIVAGLQAALLHYGGTVDKISVDSKGTNIMAVFGLPLLANEDDPERAVLAAQAIQTALAAHDTKGSIGLATGQAFCGTVGSEMRRDYTVIGDVVNLAARLMQMSMAEPNSGREAILCDEATYELTANRFEFVELDPVMVKGKALAVATYRPVRELHAVERTSPSMSIIGRNQERTILADQIQKLLFGSSGVMILTGEAGIGKSNLIDDLRRQANAWPVTLFTSSGDAVARATPYHGWRAIFAQLFNIGGIPSRSTQRQHVLNWLEAEPDLLPLAPLLGAVLPFPFADNAHTAAMSGQIRADNTRSLLITLLERLADRLPKVVILEDAQWLDSASWALALEVSRRIQPLLLIVVTRPLTQPYPAGYQALLQRPNSETLRVRPLSDAQIVMLARERLGATYLPPTVAELIVSKAEGNPFICHELVATLLNANAIEVVDHTCLIASDANLARLALPTTLQGLTISRIDKLPPSAQLTAKVSSVLGRQFSLATLQAIYPIETDLPYLADHLDVLIQHGLLEVQSNRLPPFYEFRHSTIQEAAYNLLLFEQRRQLHLATAHWYEHQMDAIRNEAALDDSVASTRYLPLLVHHYNRAQKPEHERHFAQLAAQQAMAEYANEEALAFLSRALALTDETDSELRFQLVLAQEEINERLNAHGQQARDLQILAALATVLDDDQKRIEVALRQAAYALATGDYQTGLEQATRAIQQAELLESTTLQAAGYLRWGQILLRLNRPEAAADRLQQAIRRARAQRDPLLEATSLRHLGQVALQRNQLQSAVGYIEEALDLYRGLDDRRGEASALKVLGLIHVEQAHYEVALPYFQSSLDINRAIGNLHQEALVLRAMGECESRLMHFHQANQHLHDAWIIYLEMGGRQEQSELLLFLANNAHRVGDLVAAKIYYEQAVALQETLLIGESVALTYSGMALLYFHMGYFDEAIGIAEQAVQLAEEAHIWSVVQMAKTIIGWAYYRNQNRSGAIIAWQAAISIGREREEKEPAWLAMLGLAHGESERGNVSPAATRIEPIVLRLLRNMPLGKGLWEQIDPYFAAVIAIHILSAVDDSRASKVYEIALAQLNKDAAKIDDPILQRQFVGEVNSHVTLLRMGAQMDDADE